jgi:hypothetical protein
VNEPVLAILNGLMSDPAYDTRIIFSSGRPEKCREGTVVWLAGMWPGTYTLLMRKDGDYRQDCIIKQEMLDGPMRDMGATKDTILCAMDDRQQVVDMWRANGVICLQVAEGKF